MNNDLKQIKERLLNDDKIGELLELMGCNYVTRKNTRYEAQLPDKFESPNKRSVQVYLNESLSSRIRTLGESDIDIYGLVSYIVFDLHSVDEHRYHLPKAKQWICEQMGYKEFLDASYKPEQSLDQLKWLKEIKRSRKKKRNLSDLENPTYDDDIMENFIMNPHQIYLDEGVGLETQKEFQIGYDLRSRRIVFPIHNNSGEIVSIKGRTIVEDYESKDVYKFMYLINFNKMVELYNFHRAAYYIMEKKEVLIYEGEKTCWLSSQAGYRNCVAISGDDLSEWQVNAIKELGLEIDIVIALDKDKDIKAIKKQAAKFGRARNVYSLFDKDGLYANKDSPFDKGVETFERLYSKYKYRVPV